MLKFLFLTAVIFGLLSSCAKDSATSPSTRGEPSGIYFNIKEGKHCKIMIYNSFGDQFSFLDGAELTSFLPKEDRICFINKDGNTYFSNFEGKASTYIAKGTKDPIPAFYSKNGNKIAFINDKKGTQNERSLYIYDVNSKKTTKIVDDIADNRFAEFSADGNMILFMQYKNTGNKDYAQLVQSDLAGKNQRVLVKDALPLEGFYGLVDWSDDNKYIATISYEEKNNQELVILSPDGSIYKKHGKKVSSEFFFPVFSPDSKRIAFIRTNHLENRSTLEICNIDGSSNRVLANFDTKISNKTYIGPTWSQNNQSIAYYFEHPNGKKTLRTYSIPESKVSNEYILTLKANETLGHSIFWK